MGLDYKDKTKDSVKDSNAVSDKESDEEEIKKMSTLDYKKEPKESEEEKFNKMSRLDSKDFKSKDNDMDNKMTQGTSEEKKESKWDNIDWSKDTIERKKETKWDNIDWSKTNSEEKKETKWDNIDWSKDASKEKKIEEYKNDKKEDNMMSGEDFKEKIEDINFNEKEKDSKAYDLNCLKDFEENFSNDKDNFEKDFVENINDDVYNNKEFEGLRDISEEKDKDFENINDISEDNQKGFVESIENKLYDHDFDKDFIEGIVDEKDHLDISKDFVEGIEYILEDSDIDKNLREGIDDELDSKDINRDFIEGINNVTNEEVLEENYRKENQQFIEERALTSDILNDIRENMGKIGIKNEIRETDYKNLLNDDLQKKFKEFLNNRGNPCNRDTDVNKDFTHKIDNEINKKINPKSIYLVGNKLNGKVYVGKTEKTIEERWKVHLEKARFVKNARENGKKIEAMHFTNALAKYGEKIWEKYKIDTANTKKELDKKETDWIAFFREKLGRNKVYNTHDGGTGGAQPEEILQKSRDTMSKTMIKKWAEDKFKNIQSEAISAGLKNWWGNRAQTEKDNHIGKMSKAMKQKWNNDEYREKQGKITSKKLEQRWKNDEYRQNQTKAISIAMKEHWKDDEIKKNHSKAVSKGLKKYWKRKKGSRINEIYLRNPIKNVDKFLIDIQKLKEKELSKKYNRNPNTIRKNIQYILGKDINTLRKVRKYLNEIDNEENNSTK